MKKNLFIFFIFIFGIFILAGTIGAEGTTFSGEIKNPLQAEGFEDIVDGIINFIFKLAIVLAPLMILVGGFMYLTSAGETQKLDKAKKILIWTSVGFGIVMLAKAFMSVIESIIGIK